MPRPQRRQKKAERPEIRPELQEILDKYDIDWSDEEKLWNCHGTMVLYHKAYEIIAAQENIQFDAPIVIEGRVPPDLDQDTHAVAIVVGGHLGERYEWSIGEASHLNYRRKSEKRDLYPYAMAEKRGKDRVIAKLVGLAAYCYSEEEAEEFKDARVSRSEPREEPSEKDDAEARTRAKRAQGRAPGADKGAEDEVQRVKDELKKRGVKDEDFTPAAGGDEAEDGKPMPTQAHQDALEWKDPPEEADGWDLWTEAVDMAVDMCRNQRELNDLWLDQETILNELKETDKDRYRVLHSKFKARQVLIEADGRRSRRR